MSTKDFNVLTIRQEAAKLGFDEIRFTHLDPAPGVDNYNRFIDEGRHGEMGWMERGQPPRANPFSLLPGAKSVIVLGMNYSHPRPPDPGGLTGKVASYAWGRDYHNRIGKRLKKLDRNLREQIPGFLSYGGVDSRPLIERAWAQRAGLGFLGKNCLAILPGRSSYFFIAVMLVNIDLPPDTPLGDHCGSCQRCLDVCPTGAFTAPGELDARRCISYLTIEHKGEIPTDLRQQMGRWVFGCDDCQEVCPHNPKNPIFADPEFAPRAGHAWLDLEWVLLADDDTLKSHFQGSPIRRPGPQGLKRNAAIVLGNMGDPSARTSLLRAMDHSDAIVKSHAKWALDRL